VQRERLDAQSGTGDGVHEQRSAVVRWQVELGTTLAQARQVRRWRNLAESETGKVLQRAPGGQERTAHPVGAGQHGLAHEVGPELVQLAVGKATKDWTNPDRAATPALMTSAAK